MAAIKERFQIPKRYNTLAFVLMAIGIIAIIALYINTHRSGGTPEEKYQGEARFWASLLQNSVYFLLTTNAVMFFMCALTLAWGGWQMSFRRVSEAISVCVPVVGVICGVILLVICFSDNHLLYHWTDPHAVSTDEGIDWKSGFLNKGFFTFWTIFTIAAWSLLGWKMRNHSRMLDEKPLKSIEEGKRYMWNSTVWSAIYIVIFALTVMSSIPWLWLMSIDVHWYSTMYSWYTFASTFVAGIALITVFVIFLKNSGYLEYTNSEHLHDLAKFQFAFSIFWTYLWFAQLMLIWYANIPEETIYFKPRYFGAYSGIFWMTFLINFIAPLLIFMSRDSKRNYATVTFMSLLILFGHWLDFYQMVFPGAVSADHVPNMLADFGVAAGFAGLILFVTGRALTKAPMIPKNHPMIKESMIHHT